MSKYNQNTFDSKYNNINKEINDQINKVQKNQMVYTYARIPKNIKNNNSKNEEKNKRNINGSKKLNSSTGENIERKNLSYKNNSNNNHNSNISTDKGKNNSKKEYNNLNILRAKVLKSKNFDHVERVVIDLVNNNDSDTIKTESIITSNIYENDNFKDKSINKSNEGNENNIMNNKDNNISRTLTDISIAINKIQERWKDKCIFKKEKDLSIVYNEVDRKKREIEIILNLWKDSNKIIKEDKLSIFNNNNIINNWKNNSKNIQEINLSFLIDESKNKEKELNKWKNNNCIQIIKNENISYLIDNLKLKEKEMNNFINRWLHNKSIISENISFLVDELKLKESEIQKNINKWKNDCKTINLENISFLVDNSKIKEKNIQNNIERWINKSKTINLENISFLVDNSKIKEKNIQNNIERWINNSKTINLENISFLVDINNIKEKENQNIIDKWKNNNQKENIIFLSYETKIDQNNFKYSEKKYMNDIMENIYICENNKNNIFILNYENNTNNMNKIKYKIIKPKNKKEFESILYNFYSENKKIIEKSDDLNKDNNLSQILINKEGHINPIFILNDYQIKQLYEEFNNKKEWKNIDLTISYELELNYEIIEPYLPSESNRNNLDNKFEKITEFNLEGEKKLYQDFGETTPLSMLQDKFYVYAVSRNIKYSIQSPQSFITYANNADFYGNEKTVSFKNTKINHFSLWIERVDKFDSYRSSELNETLDKK